MSQEQNPGSNPENVQPEAEVQQQEREEYVPKTAYENVSKDMHKYKDEKKRLAAEKNELEARLKAIEEEKLVEQERYKELFEKERSQRELKEKELQAKEDRYNESLKKSALRSELGNINPAYLVHADLSAIDMLDDGTVSPESVREIANKFRQDHPALIPANDGQNITGDAPPSKRPLNQPKELADMSLDEKVAYLASMKTKEQELLNG